MATRLTLEEARELIAGATTKTELRRGYRAIIRRRHHRHFVLYGPEFFGCINSGDRARLSWDGSIGFLGTDAYPRREVVTDLDAALNAFLDAAMKAVRFNVKGRAAVARARAKAATDPEQARLEMSEWLG